MAVDHLENNDSLPISAYGATDPEAGRVTLSLSGDDNAKFELTSNTPGAGTTGATATLAFREKPDFEMPGDRNRDNIYEVTVQASDGTNTAMRAVTVKVIDAEEDGKVTLSSQDPLVGTALTATLEDSDGDVTGVKWTWHRLATAATEAVRDNPDTDATEGNAIAMATSDTYTPTLRDKDMFLRAMASYTDRTYDDDDVDDNNDADGFKQFMQEATSMATTMVQDDPANQAPEFDEGSAAQRSVEENTEAGTNIGDPVNAEDDDGDDPAYALGGTDMASFSIDPDTGQLMTKAKLNYEAKSRHTVTVTADDGTGASNNSDTITVTIMVKDLDEPSVITGSKTQPIEYNENETVPVDTLTAEDPEEVDPPMVWSLLEAPGGITVGGTALTTDDVADFGDFEIDPQTGVLDFAMKPNYEIPTDAGLNNEYKVVVQASDGGRTNHLNWFKVTVRVQDIEETGKVTWTVDPDGTNGVLATPNLLQFQPGAVLTASVTDPDGDAGATAPSGTAISDFSIETVSWKWYRSSSKSSMGTDEISGAITNTYTVKDSPADSNDVGKYLWVVASYTDRIWSGNEAKFVSPNPVQRTKTNENAVPEFIETNFERTVAENTDKDINIGARARATDDDGDVLTYSLDVSGVPDCTSDDDACFGIDAATGQVMTRAELDYETKTSYTVMVKATDSSGGEGTATIAITVSNVNEEPDFGAIDSANTPPENTKGMAVDHLENNDSLPISAYGATDPEAGRVTLSLSGDDNAKFELTSNTPGAGTTGATATLAFREKPDFEMPGDRNRDNIYEVTVQASDGTNTAMRAVTVKVIDAEEDGKVTLSSQDPLVGTALTATLEDSDGDVTGVKWTWHRLATAATEAVRDNPDTDATEGNAIAMATSDTYTPTLRDKDMFLRAMASYTDRTYDDDDVDDNNDADGFKQFMQEATSMATTMVQDDPANQAPEFDEGSAAQRSVEENTEAGTNIGDPVNAEDDDGDDPAYALGGTDMASFSIDPDTGQLMTKAKLNYEAKSRHTVTVTADDGTGASNNSDTITVTIMVKDLDEPPVIREAGLTISGDPSSSSITYEENGMVDVATYMAVGPDADGATLTLGGVDAGDFTFRGGVLSFRSSPDYENPVDMDMDNRYMITVNASDGTYTATRNVVVAVTNVAELGMVSGEANPYYEEKDTAAVATYTTDGSVSATWTLSGDDAGDFAISNDGELTFTASPDYEAAADADTNNVYQVTVEADAGGETGTVAVSVTVTNVDEDGTVSLDSETARVGTELTATLDDPDGATGATWQWAKSMEMDGNFVDIEDATSASYTPVEADEGYYLQVTVTYTDGDFGSDTETMTSGPVGSADAVLANFDSDSSGTIERSEVIAGIQDYLTGTSDVSRAEVIALIQRYLAGN